MTLQNAIPATDLRDRAISVANASIRKLNDDPPMTVSGLHGVEGPAAAAYFEAWQSARLLSGERSNAGLSLLNGKRLDRARHYDPARHRRTGTPPIP